MTPGGWINLILSVGTVTLLFAWCIYRVLTAPKTGGTPRPRRTRGRIPTPTSASPWEAPTSPSASDIARIIALCVHLASQSPFSWLHFPEGPNGRRGSMTALRILALRSFRRPLRLLFSRCSHAAFFVWLEHAIVRRRENLPFQPLRKRASKTVPDQIPDGCQHAHIRFSKLTRKRKPASPLDRAACFSKTSKARSRFSPTAAASPVFDLSSTFLKSRSSKNGLI